MISSKFDLLLCLLQIRILKISKQSFQKFLIFEVFSLMPFFLYILGIPLPTDNQFLLSILATGLSLFFVGSLRTFFTQGSWIKNGSQMLMIGSIAATIAYLLGALVEKMISSL